MAPTLRLYYFGQPGRAGVVRMMLDYAEIPFENFIVDSENWPNLKPEMPWGQIPVLEVDGKKFGQSVAIQRYVAKLANLVGDNDLENLEIDSIVDTIGDIGINLMMILCEKDEKIRENLNEIFLTQTLPFFLKKFDNMAAENDGHLVLKRLTWADLLLVAAYESIVNRLQKDVFADYPNLIKMKQTVLALPTIKNHINNRAYLDGLPGTVPFYNLKNDI